MTDNYVLHSDHLAHRQSGQNCVIAKDDIGKPRPRCNGIDVRANGRPCGQGTEWDAVGAGEMIWKWKNHTPSPDPHHSHAPKSSGSRASSMKQSSDKASLSSAGKENRPRGPQSSLSACVRNDFGNDMEERLVDNYRMYSVEKNRKEQPLRIKMTNHTRTKILRTRNPKQAPELKDRWLMSRFKNVPSHFEQDRALAKSSSAPDLKPQEQTPPVLNWPPQLEIISKSDVAGSRISATPSNIRLSSNICSHVSGEVHQQFGPVAAVSQVSASVPASQLLVRQSAALSNVSLNPPASQVSLVEPGTTCLSASTPAPVGSSCTSGVSGRPPLCLKRPASAGANFCSASSRLSASLQGSDQASLAGTASAPALPLAPAVRKPRPSSSRPSALRPIPEEANSSGLCTADATRSLAVTVPPRTRPSSAQPSSVAASQLPLALAEVRHKAHWDMGSPIETPGQARSMKGNMAEGRPAHQHKDGDAEALSGDCHADTRSKLHLPRSRSLGPKPCRSCLCW